VWCSDRLPRTLCDTMGKGGASVPTATLPTRRYPAPKQERGELSTTLAQPCDVITKRSVREAIPAHCFVRSTTLSMTHLVWDCVMVGAAFWAVHAAVAALPAAASPAAWLLYWWYQGLTFTGLWVLAHECGHGGFTDSRLLNDFVGFVLHSSLITPYFSWAITHAKHHHYTNHMTMGETWVPSTADADKKSVKVAKTPFGTIKRIVLIALMGWYMYLIFNATGAKQNMGQSHFNPKSKSLFKRKDANYVRASNIGMFFALVGCGMGVYTFGFAALVRSYLIPQMICNFYLAAITFMQHTHPEVPHFDDDQWTWLRGALSTIDRTMGPFADMKTHYIVPSHVAHHIFSDMPFYGAMEATPYIKQHLGKYYKAAMPKKVLGSEYLGYWADFYEMMNKAVTIGYEEGSDFMWFH